MRKPKKYSYKFTIPSQLVIARAARPPERTSKAIVAPWINLLACLLTYSSGSRIQDLFSETKQIRLVFMVRAVAAAIATESDRERPFS